MNNFGSDEWRQGRKASMERRRFEGLLSSFDKSKPDDDPGPYLLDDYKGRIITLSKRINDLAKAYPDDPPIEEECQGIEEYLGQAF